MAAEQEQRRHEAAVADREALVKKLEGQQFQVKSNDAYKALLHEIDQARAGISEAETRILEAMEGIEAMRAAYSPPPNGPMAMRAPRARRCSRSSAAPTPTAGR